MTEGFRTITVPETLYDRLRKTSIKINPIGGDSVALWKIVQAALDVADGKAWGLK